MFGVSSGSDWSGTDHLFGDRLNKCTVTRRLHSNKPLLRLTSGSLKMRFEEWEELRLLRRLMATHCETWVVVGREVRTEEGEDLGQMRTELLASLVCRVHNLFLPMVNIIVMTRKKLGDRRRL